MPFFYYVNTFGSLSPRKCEQFAVLPTGKHNEDNAVWKTEISAQEFKMRLNALDRKYRSKAEKDLQQK